MEKYSFEKAQDVANKMQDRVENEEAKNYSEAEQLVDPESKDWKQKYEERKKLIEIPDEKMWNHTFKNLKKSKNEQKSYSLSQYKTSVEVGLSLCRIEYDHPEETKNAIKAFSKGKTMIDIGYGGTEGIFAANQNARGLRIENLKLVDPYFDEKEMMDYITDKRNDYKNNEVIKDDGLHFLTTQEDGSGSVFLSSIDFALVSCSMSNKEATAWLKRVAQEAYRITPEGGALIVTNCGEIKEEAEKLFDRYEKIGSATFFYKNTSERNIDKTDTTIKIKLIELYEQLEILKNTFWDGSSPCLTKNLARTFENVKPYIDDIEDEWDLEYYRSSILKRLQDEFNPFTRDFVRDEEKEELEKTEELRKQLINLVSKK